MSLNDLRNIRSRRSRQNKFNEEQQQQINTKKSSSSTVIMNNKSFELNESSGDGGGYIEDDYNGINNYIVKFKSTKIENKNNNNNTVTSSSDELLNLNEASIAIMNSGNSKNEGKSKFVDKNYEIANDDYDVDMDNVPLIDKSDENYEMNDKDTGNSNNNNNNGDGEEDSEDTAQLLSLIEHHERWYTIALQVVIPYILAGFGMVGAGLVLDTVQHWTLFKEIKETYVLVPALLGLKGNLEMTLASRFSTQANLGQISNKNDIIKAICGNVALTQAQSIVVGFLASLTAIISKLITDQQLDIVKATILTCGSMTTASLASLLLTSLMMVVIIFSKKLNINPDNVATPIAASLGDLVTLLILSYLCTFFYDIRASIWIHVSIIIIFFSLVPCLIYFAYKNKYVKEALYHGWVPIVTAMLISCSGGVILSYAVDYYKNIPVYQPVINGVGGNLVAVFASRLSTSLHKTSSLTHATVSVSWAPKTIVSIPFQTFFGKLNPEATTGKVLMMLALPGHILFLFIITKVKEHQGHDYVPLAPDFVIIYLTAAVVQVFVLLIVCYWMVHLTWKRRMNPDNVCIPYLTALGDFLGTGFLAISFHSLYLMGHKALRGD